MAYRSLCWRGYNSLTKNLHITHFSQRYAVNYRFENLVFPHNRQHANVVYENKYFNVYPMMDSCGKIFKWQLNIYRNLCLDFIHYNQQFLFMAICQEHREIPSGLRCHDRIMGSFTRSEKRQIAHVIQRFEAKKHSIALKRIRRILFELLASINKVWNDIKCMFWSNETAQQWLWTLNFHLVSRDISENKKHVHKLMKLGLDLDRKQMIDDKYTIYKDYISIDENGKMRHMAIGSKLAQSQHCEPQASALNHKQLKQIQIEQDDKRARANAHQKQMVMIHLTEHLEHNNTTDNNREQIGSKEANTEEDDEDEDDDLVMIQTPQEQSNYHVQTQNIHYEAKEAVAQSTIHPHDLQTNCINETKKKHELNENDMDRNKYENNIEEKTTNKTENEYDNTESDDSISAWSFSPVSYDSSASIKDDLDLKMDVKLINERIIMECIGVKQSGDISKQLQLIIEFDAKMQRIIKRTHDEEQCDISMTNHEEEEKQIVEQITPQTPQTSNNNSSNHKETDEDIKCDTNQCTNRNLMIDYLENTFNPTNWYIWNNEEWNKRHILLRYINMQSTNESKSDSILKTIQSIAYENKWMQHQKMDEILKALQIFEDKMIWRLKTLAISKEIHQTKYKYKHQIKSNRRAQINKHGNRRKNANPYNTNQETNELKRRMINKRRKRERKYKKFEIKLRIKSKTDDAIKSKCRTQKQWRKFRNYTDLKTTRSIAAAGRLHPKFVPMPHEIDKDELLQTLSKFQNQIRYRYYQTKSWFGKKKNEKKQKIQQEVAFADVLTQQHGFQRLPYLDSKSKATRATDNAILEAALQHVRNRLLDPLIFSKKCKDNITKQQRKGIREIKQIIKTGDAVICLPDKANEFTLVPTELYANGVDDFLQKSNFKTTDEDKLDGIISTIEEFRKNKITSHFWGEYLKFKTPHAEHYGPAKIYGLYKDHKDPDENGRKPWRGICTVMNTPIERASKFISYYLHCIQMNNENIIIDMLHWQHTIKLINNDPHIKWKEDEISIVNFDIVNMYGNIDTEEGIAVCNAELISFYELIKEEMKEFQCVDTFIPNIDDFCEFMRVVHTNNYAIFNEVKRIQGSSRGGGMGYAHTPKFADIAVFPIVRRMIQDFGNVIIKNGVKIYRDDVPFIYKGAATMAPSILNTINTYNTHIQFTLEKDDDVIFGKEIHFLNGTFMVTECGIESKHYIKPTKCTVPLPPHSLHNPEVFRALPSTYFHTIRSIADDKYVHEAMDTQAIELINENYNIKHVLKTQRKYTLKSKEDLLYATRNSYNLKQLRTEYKFDDDNDPWNKYERARRNRTNQNKKEREHNRKQYGKKTFFNRNNILFIIKFHPNIPSLDIIFDEFFEILKKDPTLCGEYGIFKRDDISFYYRRYKNMREILPVGKIPKAFYSKQKQNVEDNDDSKDDIKEDNDNMANDRNPRARMQIQRLMHRILRINNRRNINIKQHINYLSHSRQNEDILLAMILPFVFGMRNNYNNGNRNRKKNDIRSFLVPKSIIQRTAPMAVSTLPNASGCYNCAKRCAMCCYKNNVQGTQFMMNGSYFISTNTNECFPITQIFDCESNWVIYSLYCIKCGIQSVGSTINPKTRFSTHKSDINKNKVDGCIMVKHFNDQRRPCYDEENRVKHLRIIIIDGLKDDELTHERADGRLNKLERLWQARCITMHNGGNDTKDYNNKGFNRRNYQEKNKNKITKLHRKKRGNNRVLWDKNWIKNKEEKHIFNTKELTKLSSKLPFFKKKQKRNNNNNTQNNYHHDKQHSNSKGF